jgi:hypothetical protein
MYEVKLVVDLGVYIGKFSFVEVIPLLGPECFLVKTVSA